MSEAAADSGRLRVLIVGGYGVFGGRLAQLLADEPRLTLIIAGRNPAKAQDFCARLPALATLVAARFDRSGDIAEQLADHRPDLVVDASGPFQDYGHAAYSLVEGCITARIAYLDLADGSAFVAGIDRFDAAAKAQDVFVLAGASSFPVLTAAAAAHLAEGMAHVHAITAGVAPSPYAGVGLNVIRAVVSYAGQPVELIRDGRSTTGIGLAETRRRTISPPGQLPLRSRLFSLVDVPDLKALPRLWPELKAIWVGAGPVPEILHVALVVLARGVRRGLVPRLDALAWLFHTAINSLRWGEHRGGMFVAVAGVSTDGLAASRSWHLLAEGDDGPLIPSMAAEIIIRNMLDGERPASGARSAAGALDLAAYESTFARHSITTGIRDDRPRQPGTSLFHHVLGDAFLKLPAPIRALHTLDGDKKASGRAVIERGTNPLARPIAWLFGFPPAGRDVAVTVAFRGDNGREIWQRDFGGRRFASVLSAGTGRSDHLIEEHFGPITVALAVVATEAGLALMVRRWCLFGIPLPLRFGPITESYERVENGCFAFDIDIRLPLIGRIVRYRGALAIVDS